MWVPRIVLEAQQRLAEMRQAEQQGLRGSVSFSTLVNAVSKFAVHSSLTSTNCRRRNRELLADKRTWGSLAPLREVSQLARAPFCQGPLRMPPLDRAHKQRELCTETQPAAEDQPRAVVSHNLKH
jgi:hypothetical protein